MNYDYRHYSALKQTERLLTQAEIRYGKDWLKIRDYALALILAGPPRLLKPEDEFWTICDLSLQFVKLEGG